MDDLVLASIDSAGLTALVGYAMLARCLDMSPFSTPPDPLRIYRFDKPALDIDHAPPITARALSMTVGELKHFLAEQLEARDLMIVTLRFGLDGSFAHPLEQVGRKLSLSRERVRQLQERAITRLRAAVLEWDQEQERAWAAMTGELREQ